MLIAMPASNRTEWNRLGSDTIVPSADKDHIKERLTFSSDLGDAAALTFAVDVTPVNRDWRTPRKRPNLAHLAT